MQSLSRTGGGDPATSPSQVSLGFWKSFNLVFVAGPTSKVDFNCAGVGTWRGKEKKV